MMWSVTCAHKAFGNSDSRGRGNIQIAYKVCAVGGKAMCFDSACVACALIREAAAGVVVALECNDDAILFVFVFYMQSFVELHAGGQLCICVKWVSARIYICTGSAAIDSVASMNQV